MTVLLCEHCGARSPEDALRCVACGATTLRPVEGELTPSPSAEAAPAPAAQVAKVIAMFFAFVLVGTTAILIGLMLLGFYIGGSPAPGDAVVGPAEAPPVRPLTVAVDPEAPPFLARAGGGWEGFEYALISAIGHSMGRPVELVPTPYDDILGAVAEGRVSMAVAQLPPHDVAGVVWSRSYLQYALCLVTRADDPRASLGAFRGAKIGRYADETAAELVRVALGGGATEVVYEDAGYFADLEGGKLDAVVYDCPLARHELKGHPRLRIADDHLGLATYSVAIPASEPALAQDVDRVLVDLGNQGLFAPLVDRWLGGAPNRDFEAATGRVVVVGSGEDLDAAATRALGPGRTADLAAWNVDILGTGAPSVYPGLMLRVR